MEERIVYTTHLTVRLLPIERSFAARRLEERGETSGNVGPALSSACPRPVPFSNWMGVEGALVLRWVITGERDFSCACGAPPEERTTGRVPGGSSTVESKSSASYHGVGNESAFIQLTMMLSEAAQTSIERLEEWSLKTNFSCTSLADWGSMETRSSQNTSAGALLSSGLKSNTKLSFSSTCRFLHLSCGFFTFRTPFFTLVVKCDISRLP
mmetsp:Transcript_9845/g.39930  ORF Transcript_9845/g.39930 Transcript_9845/m.39930 type:complete len:211 (+) Transcript_9845:1367-1999(+)